MLERGSTLENLKKKIMKADMFFDPQFDFIHVA